MAAFHEPHHLIWLPMNRFTTFLTTAALLSLAAGQACAADKPATEKPAFVPPAAMVQNWTKFSDQPAIGRIKELSSWKRHEKFAPCTADANLCKMITDSLSILTVEVAKLDGQTITWVVSVPLDQDAKIGQYVQFSFPTEAKGLAAGAYDQKTNRLVIVPKCTWGKDDTVAQSSTGVLCPQWRYGQMAYFKAAASAPAPATPVPVPASAPAAASQP